MPIYSLTPEFQIHHAGHPSDELHIVDNRFVGHIGDLLSLLVRLNVVFHDSQIGMRNNIVSYSLTEIVVRPVPGNHERIAKDLDDAFNHLELLLFGQIITPEGTFGWKASHHDRMTLSGIQYELRGLRSMLVRAIICEECPERLRIAGRFGEDPKVVYDLVANKIAEYKALEAAKQHPWTAESYVLLEQLRKERALAEEEIASHFPDEDLLLPPEMAFVTPSKPNREQCRIDLSSMGLSPEQLTGLAVKAKEFGADYDAYDKGVILSYIPFRDEFAEGVFDE